jgi:uroporphyrinogen-III synthase
MRAVWLAGMMSSPLSRDSLVVDGPSLLGESIRVTEALPLSGKTVALLRAHGQGGELARGLEALGARVLEVPLLAIGPPADGAALARAAREARSFDWIALTSPNAVATFAAAVEEAHAMPAREVLARVALASVGPGTTSAARKLGLEVALEASESLQEGLAQGLIARGVSGQRILLPRGDQARDALERALHEAGASVTAVVAYETLDGEGDVSVLSRAVAEGTLDAVCFTSASTVRSLARRIGDMDFGRWFSERKPLAASMGPLTSEALRELGVEPHVEAREHTAQGLVSAVREALRG